MKAILVYQGGIANVFRVPPEEVTPRLPYCHRDRLLQNNFASCAWFCRGLAAAGWDIQVMGCNRAGDISREPWTEELDDLPFSDKFVRKF